jgi:hypothetical protein
MNEIYERSRKNGEVRGKEEKRKRGKGKQGNANRILITFQAWISIVLDENRRHLVQTKVSTPVEHRSTRDVLERDI